MPTSPSKRIFITGTDTGVGKTLVTALICRALQHLQVPFRVMKPIETGCSADANGILLPADGMLLQKAAGSGQSIDEITPFKFSAPVAPLIAAKQESRPLLPQEVAEKIKQNCSPHELLIWEGAGGLLVPIAEDYTFADLALDINSACLLVVGSRLGAINHALLSMEVLQQRGIPLIGYVLNDLFGNKQEDTPAKSTNRELLRHCARKYQAEEICCLPYLPETVDITKLESSVLYEQGQKLAQSISSYGFR